MTKTRSTYLALVTILLSPMAANADLIQYTGVGVEAGGGISLGDTISILFDYDSSTGFQSGSGPGQISYVGALSNFNIVTTAAIPTTVLSSSVSVANVNFFGFEGYVVNMSFGNSTFLNITLPFDIAGTSLALPSTLPSSNQIDLSRLGTINAFAAAGIHLQYLDGAEQVQFARFDFGPIASVPEPGTFALFGIGLAAMGLSRRKKKA
jgi:hypothetical protein